MFQSMMTKIRQLEMTDSISEKYLRQLHLCYSSILLDVVDYQKEESLNMKLVEYLLMGLLEEKQKTYQKYSSGVLSSLFPFLIDNEGTTKSSSKMSENRQKLDQIIQLLPSNNYNKNDNEEESTFLNKKYEMLSTSTQTLIELSKIMLEESSLSPKTTSLFPVVSSQNSNNQNLLTQLFHLTIQSFYYLIFIGIYVGVSYLIYYLCRQWINLSSSNHQMRYSYSRRG